MTNFPTNLEDVYLARTFDPDTKITAPWQSGMTGIGYDTRRPATSDSLNAFWDTEVQGQDDYLDEMRDAVGLSAIQLGARSVDDHRRPVRRSRSPRSRRRSTSRWSATIKGNDYLRTWPRATSSLAMAWSGDIVSSPATRRRSGSAVAKEGGMLWTDNMLIPKGAPNKEQAEAFIDFYYDPASPPRSRPS